MKAEAAAQVQFLGRQRHHRNRHVAAQAKLHDHAARAHRADPGRQRGRRARTFVEHVEMSLVGGIGQQRLGVFGQVQRQVRTHPARGPEGEIRQVRRHDLRRPRPPRGQDRQQSDRPASCHQNPRAQQIARPARRVQDHRQRFGHRGLASAKARRIDALRRIRDQQFAERPLHMRIGHGRSVEAHVHAMVRQSLAAGAAIPAGPRRRDGDKLARREALDPRPKRLDPRRDLVPEDHRLAQAHAAEPAVIGVMQVRTADPAALQPHKDLTRRGDRIGAILDPQVMGGVDDKRAHHDTSDRSGRPAK